MYDAKLSRGIVPGSEFILELTHVIRSTLDTVPMIVHNASISWFLTFVPPDGSTIGTGSSRETLKSVLTSSPKLWNI